MQTIELIRDGAIARVQLNRADKHNAINEVMIAELTQQFLDLEADPSVRVIVLAAQGKHFCAGADLAWMQKMANYSEQENRKDASDLARLFHTIHQLDKPILAIVDGAAYGGALGLLSCADIVVTSKRAQFCFSEVKLGIIPATISPYVIQKIGLSHARRFFISAEVFSADKAQQIGLVHRLCSFDQLEQKADEVIVSLLQNGPNAMRATKQLLRELAPIDLDTRVRTSEWIAHIRTTPEAQHGLQAFLQKQQPDWVTK